MDNSRFKLIVSSGPTREWIDPVRFISNPSTGQMGYQIAKAGLACSFREVVLISGASIPAYRTVEGARNIQVDTTQSMADAVLQESETRSILIMAAAPADFTPVSPSESKTKKNAGKNANMQIQLKPTVDILMACKDLNYDHYYRIGFAAETDNIREYAEEKLKRKQLDFICANQVYKESKGFGFEENSLLVLGKDNSEKEIGPFTKEKLAEKLLHYLLYALQNL